MRIDAPNLKVVAAEGFSNCYSLRQINTLNIEKIGSNSFYYNECLKKFAAPKLKAIEENSFHYCSALADVDVPQVEKIPASAFFAAYLA